MSWFEYATRSSKKELIDCPNFPTEQVERTFRDMTRLNRGLGGYLAMNAWARGHVQKNATGRLTLADLGCGNGDFFCHLMRHHPDVAQRLDLVAVDGNADALECAPKQCKEKFQGSVKDYLNAHEPDLAVLSLVAHHMDDEEIVELLMLMNSKCRVGWLIVDLHRHRFSALSIAAISTMFAMAPAVRHDGPLSVKRGFVRGDWHKYLTKAGVDADVRWAPLFRWCVQGKAPK